jgi:hypothetical protein
MVVLVNRAKMTTSTTGTGTITLGSVVDGYQTFAAAGVSNGDSVRYVIEDGTSNWEIGSGTYTASGTTLSRNPSESSDGGSAITLSGDAIVFISAIASDIQPITYVTTTFTATAAQTTFTVSYTAGLVEVFLNGAKLSGADFTATNGTSIVLASGANVGDTVDVIAYGTVSVANTYTQAQADALFVDVAGGANVGDTVDVIAYGTVSVANTYTQAQADALFVDVAGDTMTGALNVQGTVTADGLTVDGTANLQGTNPDLYFVESDTTDLNTYIANGSGNFTTYTANDAKNSFKQRINLDHATGDISFYEDTGTTPKFFWDASAESLGIGTSSPSAPLEIIHGSTSVGLYTRGSYNYQAKFESTDAEAAIVIEDSNSTNDGNRIGVITDNMTFITANSERMRIDSSGNLLVGKTAANNTAAGHVLYTGGLSAVVKDNGTVQILNRLTSDGTIVDFRKDSTTVGSIGALSGDVYIQGPTNHSGIQFNTNGVLPLRNSAIVDNTLDIGGSSYRWKDLYLSGKAYDGDGNLRAIPRTGSEKTSSYTLTTSDVGLYVQVGSGGSVTIPNSTFSQGDAVSIFNHTSGDITITCSISTAYIAGTDGDVNSVTLATRGVCTILFISTTLCVLSGNVS